MEWLSIIVLILVGIAMLIIELIFIPGTTVFGILGFAGLLSGVYLGYANFDATTGTIILVSTLLLSGIAVFYSLRSKSWDRFALKTNSDSKVNEETEINLETGQEGIAISYLRPSGKAEFDGKFWEVFSHDEFIESGTAIVIEKIEKRKIFVKPKS